MAGYSSNGCTYKAAAAQKTILYYGRSYTHSNSFRSLQDAELSSWVPEKRLSRTSLPESVGRAEGVRRAVSSIITGSHRIPETLSPIGTDGRHLNLRGSRASSVSSMAGTEEFLDDMGCPSVG